MAKNIFSYVAGGYDMFGVLVDIALTLALIPTIKGFISGAQNNLSAGEYVVLSLVTTFIVFALVYNVGKQTGIIRGKK